MCAIDRASGRFFMGHCMAANSADGIGNNAKDPARRQFIRHSGAMTASALMGAVASGVRSGAWAAGTDAPEITELRVGFMPLTDCASIAVAAEQGFDSKHGIRIVPVKKTSWAAMRDGLLGGELHAAHVLYGLVYGVQTGIGGLQRDMSVLMTLNRNGQGIVLSKRLREAGVTDGDSLRELIARGERDYAFAQTFPTGTHAMWLYYWLAANGIHPLRDVSSITVRPPQMVAHLRTGNIDGCCVGEPWSAQAVRDGAGCMVARSQDVWPDHPEKVLGATAEFAERHPNAARALIMALLEASRFIDTASNRPAVARLIAGEKYVGADLDVIEPHFLGHYSDGLGRRWTDATAVKFFDDGAVNFPYLSDGIWFLTQLYRWGMLRQAPDYAALANKVNRVELYAQAAQALGVSLPSQPNRSSTLMDGRVWDAGSPARYGGSFEMAAA